MDDRYFTEEMNYLLEQGKEFARKNPQKARMLHLDDSRSRDPNVERLLESFAFLSSRVRKRLDDDFSNIADGLLSLIWPGYLNPVPSFCFLQFKPSSWDFTDVSIVPAGAEIDSKPLSDGLRCRFRTCFETAILPIEVAKVTVESSGSSSTLKLSFSLNDTVNHESLTGHKLRVQLCGEVFNCWQLYNILLGKKGKDGGVESIKLEAFDTDRNTVLSESISTEAMRPGGLDRAETLLPEARASLWSYSLIRDFFVFPEKFQAFELDALGTIASTPSARTFEISFSLNSPWPSNLRVDESSFGLNTVPIVNLFDRDADPIRMDQLHSRYTVRGDIKYPEFNQVYSVDTVYGIEVGTGNRKKYEPLFSAQSNADLKKKSYFSIEREKAAWGGAECYISFKGAVSDSEFPEQEIVSLNLTCTNGGITRQILPDQITDPVSGIDGSLGPTNITHPTEYFPVSTNSNSLWKWVSHASLNYLSLFSIEQFKSMLRLHDLSESETNRHKIDGVVSISMEPIRRLFKGAIVPGNSISVVVQESHFADMGEIQLFAKILSAFLSSFASINSYVQLSLTVEPSGQKIIIQPSLGESFQL